LQSGFDAWFNHSQTLPVLIAVSILFGLAHNITKVYFLLAFLIALYLGALLLLTQNLLVPVAVHALYDFCVFIAVRRELKINGG
jgi:membrane protease YdiL (CAAX protease family)